MGHKNDDCNLRDGGFNLNWFELIAPDGYQQWRDLYLPVVLGSETNDDDNDGVDNLMEYALGGNPTNAAYAGILPELMQTNGNFFYIHPQRSDDPQLTYLIETTTNLVSGSWTNLGVAAVGTNVTESTLNTVTNSISVDEPKCYIRLNVVKEEN